MLLENKARVYLTGRPCFPSTHVHARPGEELLGACHACGSAGHLCDRVCCSQLTKISPSFPTVVQWKQFNPLLKITGRKRTSLIAGGLRLKSDSRNSMCGEADRFPLPPGLAVRHHSQHSTALASRGQTSASHSQSWIKSLPFKNSSLAFWRSQGRDCFTMHQQKRKRAPRYWAPFQKCQSFYNSGTQYLTEIKQKCPLIKSKSTAWQI